MDELEPKVDMPWGKLLPLDNIVEPLPYEYSNVKSAVPLLPELILVGGEGGVPFPIGIFSDMPDFVGLRTLIHFLLLLMI